MKRQDDGRLVFERRFDTPQGTNGEHFIRVILEKTGEVVTTFPAKEQLIIIPGAGLGIDLLGDNIFGEAVELINPLSDIQSLIDLVVE